MAKSEKNESPVAIEGTCEGVQLEKRFYLPGITIKSKCPKCGTPWERDMGGDYLSYPTVGQPSNAYGYCRNEECEHEWPVMVIVRVTLEAAP
jgi:hypothetical protein